MKHLSVGLLLRRRLLRREPNFCIIRHEVVNQVLGRIVHWVGFQDLSERLRIAFSDHNLGSFLNEFDTVLKFEANLALIIGSHASHVSDLDRLDCLTNATDMQHTLEAIFDSRVMMQDLHMSIEVLDT